MASESSKARFERLGRKPVCEVSRMEGDDHGYLCNACRDTAHIEMRVGWVSQSEKYGTCTVIHLCQQHAKEMALSILDLSAEGGGE